MSVGLIVIAALLIVLIRRTSRARIETRATDLRTIRPETDAEHRARLSRKLACTCPRCNPDTARAQEASLVPVQLWRTTPMPFEEHADGIVAAVREIEPPKDELAAKRGRL